MFTGIIKQLGIIKDINQKVNSLKIGVELNLKGEDVSIGDSLSINGVCLTVVKIIKNVVYFEVIDETLKKSNLSFLKIGDRVNVEFSLKASDRISGHFVTGHIDCLGKIEDKIKEGQATYFKISFSKEFKRLISPKASVAVNGISLTIVEAMDDYFSFYAIGHTMENTNLKLLNIGDPVNIEFDILAKYINKSSHLNKVSSSITKEYLKEKGFI